MIYIRKTCLVTFALLLIAIEAPAQEVGSQAVVIVPGDLKVGKTTVGQMELGASDIVKDVKGDWINILGGWAPRSSLKSPEEAESFFAELVRREPKNEIAWFGLANSRRLSGHYEGAFEAIRRGLELNPKKYNWYSIGGVNLMMQGDWKQLIQWTGKGLTAIGNDPEFAALKMNLHSLRARAYHKTRQYNDALNEISAAFESDVEDPWQRSLLLIVRAVILREVGDLSQALSSLDEAIELFEPNAPAMVDRGRTHLLMENWKSAVADFDACYRSEFQSMHPFAIATSSWAAYEAAGDGPIDPKDYPSLDPWRSPYYGLIMLRAACPDEAIRDGKAALELAARLRGLDRGRYYHFIAAEAAAYAEIGDFEKSIELQTKAIGLAPESEKADLQESLDRYRRGEPLRLEVKGDSTAANGPHIKS